LFEKYLAFTRSMGPCSNFDSKSCYFSENSLIGIKTLIRIVNETYGMWSIRLKINFVLNELLNFSQHFCGDHSSCSRFIWWTQCSNASLNQYSPALDYVNEIASGRGHRCNTYVPLFFRILVKAFTQSPYLEGLLSKCILYSLVLT
jgi:hypothetical protein